MASSQRRPRPRAKQPSVDVVQQVSPNDSQGSTLQSTLSPPPKPTRHVVDIDDDDDFFTRRRTAGQAPPVTFHASAMDMTGQEDLSEGSQGEEAQTGDGSSDEDRRRKKGRHKMSSWTKTSSFSKQDLRRRSSSQARDEDKRSRSESVVVDGQGVHEQGQQKGQRKRTRSPSLTPPPPLEKEALERLNMVLEQYNPAQPMINFDDDDLPSFDAREPLDLDPDLARLIKGSRAYHVRKQAKEREAMRLEEQEMARRAARTQQKQKEVIEVDDSDDEVMGNATATGRGSSSPVEILPSPTERAMPHIATAAREEPVWSVEPADEEEEERIDIVMKGGEAGVLQCLVKVKPTTKIKKLLDHYTQTHKASIPKARLKSVRIRFDGDSIDPNTIVGEVGIEDGEQMDVVW